MRSKYFYLLRIYLIVLFAGCGWAGQDPSAVAALLHGHAGAHLRGGLRGPGPDRRGQAGAPQDHQRQGDEGRHHTHLR